MMCHPFRVNLKLVTSPPRESDSPMSPRAAKGRHAHHAYTVIRKKLIRVHLPATSTGQAFIVDHPSPSRTRPPGHHPGTPARRPGAAASSIPRPLACAPARRAGGHPSGWPRAGFNASQTVALANLKSDFGRQLEDINLNPGPGNPTPNRHWRRYGTCPGTQMEPGQPEEP